AKADGKYNTATTALDFAQTITADLRSVTNDKHLALYFDPAQKTMPPITPARDRFDYGFNKLERLSGNVGYLEIRSFANLDQAKDTADAWLSALAGFDSIILDLRQNGGGNTPMAVYIASYFLGPNPVLFTQMHWRDQNRTIDLMT